MTAQPVSTQGGGNCFKRNVCYRDICTRCEEQGIVAHYIGQSSNSIYDRGLQHTRDIKSKPDKAHMLQHALEFHKGDDPRKLFKMQLIKPHRTAFSRMIHEAILVRNFKGVLLNSRKEYHQCLIPSIQAPSIKPPRTLRLNYHQNLTKHLMTMTRTPQ